MSGDIAQQAAPVRIRTPDQRLRVFVSSTLQELAEERRAVRAAIEGLHLTPVMFELGARPHPPRALYRAYLEQSEVFVGLYWQRYGWVAPGEDVSGLEDEYRLSGERPKLLYLKAPANDREPRLKELIKRIQDEDQASYRSFSSLQELQELLADDLSLLLTERFEASTASPTSDASARLVRPAPLPVASTALIGRDDEALEARSLLLRDDVRLVTLLGPGGIGKTRLALEVAAQTKDAFAGAVYFVNLAAIRDPRLFLPTVAGALGLRNDQVTLESLRDTIGAQRLLVVLDNFEQLLPAAVQVMDLLAMVPGLKFLVTSRAALRVSGEHEYVVPPLRLPNSSDLELLRANEAVSLFVARARAVRPDFDLDANNAPAVDEIVRRLDGLPLAIELAAAYVRLLSPEVILERLPSSLDTMRGARDLPERQRTLRATLDWSHDLLDTPQQALFARLGALVGGGTLEAIEAICGEACGDDPLGLLEGLLDHSLVQLEGDRFLMLEVVREYALEHLHAGSQLEEVFARHREHYLSFAEQAAVALRGRGQMEALRRFDLEEGNLRAVSNRALERHDANTVARVGWALSLYWMVRARYQEAERLMDAALALEPSLEAPAQARLMTISGVMAGLLSRYDIAKERLERSLRLAGTLNDLEASAVASLGLGVSLEGLGCIEDARLAFEQALTQFRQHGEAWGETFSLGCLGQNALAQGDLERAATMLEQGLELSQRSGLRMSEVLLHVPSGVLRLLRDDIRGAAAHFSEALRLSQALQYLDGIPWTIEGSAAIAIKRGDDHLAARLLGAAEVQRLAVGTRMWGGAGLTLTVYLADARNRMGDALFEQARREGARLRLGEIVPLVEQLLSSTLNAG